LELPLKIPTCDLFWSPHFTMPFFPIKASRCIVTIHDTFHLDNLHHFSLIKQMYAKKMIGNAVSKADLILTVSEFTKQRIVHHFPKTKDKIQVIYSGCDHLSHLDPEPIADVPSSFFLFVGNHKIYKNFLVALQSFMQAKEMHLIVVDKTKILEKKYGNIQDNIYFFGEVTDSQLAWLYRNARALIFPSLYEGWGLPPLEAMQLGCPVIASHRASIPEACGEAALFFDPKNSSDLLAKMHELPKVKERLILAGKQRAVQFTWEKSAKEHLKAFSAKVLSSH